MDIKAYILSIIVAALISTLVVLLVDPNTTAGTLLRLLTGVFMALTVVAPWKQIHIGDIDSIWRDFNASSAFSVSEGETAYQDALRARIKETTEAYILEKAASFGAEVTAVVTIATGEAPIPIAVQIIGVLSPYAKTQIKNMITKDLSISEEAITWNLAQ